MTVEFVDKQLENSDLVIEKKYKVISIHYVQKSKKESSFKILLRILNENGIPVLYDINSFNISDPKVDHDYVYKRNHENFEMVPKSMSYNYYWEDFFNDDEKAIQIFKSRFPEYKDDLF